MIRGTSAVAVALAGLLLSGCGQDDGKTAGAKPPTPPPAAAPLVVFVGGTMRPAMEEICKLYTQETGQEVQVNQNDSGQLLTTIETEHQGDLYVAHDPFAVAAEKKGFVDRRYALAGLSPVIVVKKGNPKGLKGIADLARDDVRVGLTVEKYSTGGYVVARILEKAGLVEKMAKKQVFRKRGGGEVANDVIMGVTDAGVVWNAVAFDRREKLEAIPVDEKFRPVAGADAISSATYGKQELNVIGVWAVTLKFSKQPANARKLAELAAGEKGRAVFAKLGYSPAPAATELPAK